MYSVTGFKIRVSRIMPYPPSFSRTAARTMEPAMGASTWALGSQRCRPYKGIFTKNAIIQASHKRELDQESVSGVVRIWITRKFRVPVVL